MLVSLTSTTPDATDLGFLLHKHPIECGQSMSDSGAPMSSIRSFATALHGDVVRGGRSDRSVAATARAPVQRA